MNKILEIIISCSIYPVSYTHLDVYKRQVLDNNTKISLYSVDGKLIGGNEIPFRRITELHLEIDLPSHFENGLYILEINNNGIITRTQLIVVK